MNALARFTLVAPLVLLGAGAPSATEPISPSRGPTRVAVAQPTGATETPGELEVARIRKHLAQAERELRARDPRALTSDQRTARHQHLARLHAYRERGRFPHNHDFPGQRVPCFVDRHGTRDILAHLMESSGQGDLVLRVSKTHNNASVRELVADTKIGPDVYSWIVSSGFTVEEAQKLQPTYGAERPVVFGEPSEISAEHA